MPDAAALFPFVRGLILLSILLLIGTAVATRLVVRHAAGDEHIVRHANSWHARLPGLIAWFLLTLSLARGALQLLSFIDPSDPVEADFVKAVLLEGTWGSSWVIQTGSALVLLAGSWLLRARRRAAWWLLTGCLGAIVIAQSGLGHPADDFWPYGLGRVASVVHVTGAGVWLGTLAVLATTTFPVLRGEGRLAILAAIVRDFSRYARVGALMVMSSGLLAAWKYVGTASGLVSSTYGRLVMAKLALMGLIVAAGYWNWRVVTPSLEGLDESAPEWLRLGVIVELVVASAVLGVTAYLVGAWVPAGMGR